MPGRGGVVLVTPDPRQVGGAAPGGLPVEVQSKGSAADRLQSSTWARAWGAKAVSRAESRGLSVELMPIFQLEPRESQVLKERAPGLVLSP